MRDISDYLSALNPRQKTAVTAEDGPLLVTAGAGSGKTAVLINRIAWLIAERKVPANRIIAVTFTNKAARELKVRVQDLLFEITDGPVEPIVGTFHGLCNQFLRIRYEEAGLSQHFSIMDQDDQKSFIASLIKDNRIDLLNILTPKSLQSYINKSKEARRRAGQGDAYYPHQRQQEQVYELYEVECEKQSRIDFAELMLRTVELMERNTQVRQHIQERFLHVLIDEFQDTNELQFRWMELFCGKHRNITAVGDEDQSIYSWRGALAWNLKRFEAVYPDTRIIRLEQNYRSTRPILDAANALIEFNSNRYEKKLWTGKSGGSPIKLFNAADADREASFVVDQINQIASLGRDWSDFAVLYRTNAQSRNFEEGLSHKGIPFRVYGGVRFYHRREVKDVLSYLQLVANPNANDALLRAAGMPPCGIGSVTKRRVATRAEVQEFSFWEAAVELAEESGGTGVSGLRNLVGRVNELKDKSTEYSLGKLIKAAIDISGIGEHLKNHSDPSERSRIENLDELINAGYAFQQLQESQLGSEILGEYLDTVVLDPGDTHDDDSQGHVQVMTLHAAKGLEFPVVFLTGLDENVLPHFFSTNRVNEFDDSNDEGIEEERRLCYVGMTRAEEVLYLTRASNRMVRGKYTRYTRSRFLAEIPRHLLENVGFDSVPEPIRPQPEAPFSRWLGVSVRHQKFGPGIVIAIDNQGAESFLTVEFEKYGAKTVLSNFVSIDEV